MRMAEWVQVYAGAAGGLAVLVIAVCALWRHLDP